MDIKWYLENGKNRLTRRSKVEKADGVFGQVKFGSPRKSK